MVRCALCSVIVLVWLCGAAGCVSAARDDSISTRQLETEVPFDPANAVIIQGDNGDVKVRRVDGTAARVRAEVRGKGESRVSAVQVVMQTTATSALSIRVDWPVGWRLPGEAVSMEVDLPGCSALTVHTGNGAIDVAELGGLAVLSSGNGEITVADHAGDVQISTSNGYVQATRIDGECRVRTSNGEVAMIDIAGRVSVSTTNGGVDLRLTDSNPGPIDIRTANGGVEIEIGDGFTGDLRLETFNGRVRILDLTGDIEFDDEREWAVVHRGGSENRSLVRTSNGRILLRSR